MRDEKEQEQLFRDWLKIKDVGNGPLSSSTILTYISRMKAGYIHFNNFKEYESLFCIQSVEELDEYTTKLFNFADFIEQEKKYGNRACRSGFAKYRDFLKERGIITKCMIIQMF